VSGIYLCVGGAEFASPYDFPTEIWKYFLFFFYFENKQIELDESVDNY